MTPPLKAQEDRTGRSAGTAAFPPGERPDPLLPLPVDPQSRLSGRRVISRLFEDSPASDGPDAWQRHPPGPGSSSCSSGSDRTPDRRRFRACFGGLVRA
jgi:hypothetical protein